MSGMSTYYVAPDADPRVRALAESSAAHTGSTYETALGAVRSVLANETISVPRYITALDRRVIRIWGAPLLRNGRKPR